MLHLIYRKVANLIGVKMNTDSAQLFVQKMREDKGYYTLATFFAAVTQNDFDAPKAGTHLLKDYYEEFSAQL